MEHTCEQFPITFNSSKHWNLNSQEHNLYTTKLYRATARNQLGWLLVTSMYEIGVMTPRTRTKMGKSLKLQSTEALLECALSHSSFLI